MAFARALPLVTSASAPPPGYKLDVNGDIRIASGSDLYSYGSATLGNRTYTEDNYVVDGQTFTASLDALDQQLFDVSSAAGTNYWQKVAGNLSPLTVGDTLSATSSASTVATFTQVPVPY